METTNTQNDRFNALMQHVDLRKLHKILFKGDVGYSYRVIAKYLRLHGIKGSMYEPELLALGEKQTYAETLRYAALMAVCEG